MPGEPAYYSGRVTDTRRRRWPRCCWTSGPATATASTTCSSARSRDAARARFRTDAEGRYRFWSIRPTFYPVPDDGPVGDMLRGMGRHPNRPGHIHMKVYAPGHVPVTTHIFVADSPYLDSDAVFGVRNSLVVKFEKHPPARRPTAAR